MGCSALRGESRVFSEGSKGHIVSFQDSKLSRNIQNEHAGISRNIKKPVYTKSDNYKDNDMVLKIVLNKKE